MNRLNDFIARVAAGAVAVGAVTGSTSALLKVANQAGMAPSWTLPLSLDGAGIVAIVAIRRRRNDWLAWGALVAATATSAAVQWLTAPDGVVNHLAHVVPPVAVLVAFELYLRVAAPQPVEPVLWTEPAEESRAILETSVAPTAPVEVEVKAAQPAPGVAQRRATPVRSVPVDDDHLLTAARKVVANLGRVPGRPTLTKLLKENGYQLGTAKAEALLATLREEDVA